MIEITIIAAVKGNDGIYIGADTLTTTYFTNYYDTKLMTFGNNAVMAFSGQNRYSDLLVQMLEEVEGNIRDRRDMIELAQWIKEQMCELSGVGRASENSLPEHEFSCIIATPKHIYMIEPDYSVYQEQKRQYLCGGIGLEYANGVFFAMKKNIKEFPKEVLHTALQAACYFSPWCSTPLTILKVEERK